MNQINQMVNAINDIVWCWPLIILLSSVGILLSFRLAFLQVIRFTRVFYYMVRNEKTEEREVSGFAALCTALSVTVGTGNIVGSICIALKKGIARRIFANESDCPAGTIRSCCP